MPTLTSDNMEPGQVILNAINYKHSVSLYAVLISFLLKKAVVSLYLVLDKFGYYGLL